MNQITKILLTLAAIAAVLGYTVYNYVAGQRDLTFLMIVTVILGIPFVNLLNILIQELKKK